MEDGVTTNGTAAPSSFLDLIKKLRARKEQEREPDAAPVPEGSEALAPQPSGEEAEGGAAVPGPSIPQGNEAPGAEPPGGPAGAQTPGPGIAEVVSDEHGVRFNFDDADVFEVVRTVLGDILQVDYIIDSGVSGRVNFRSTSVVARDRVLPLIQTILRLNGVGLVEEGGLYRVIPLGNVPREPAEIRFGRKAPGDLVEGKAIVQVVPLKHRDAEEMAGILGGYASQGAQVTAVPRSNYVVIADSDASVRRLLQLVEMFDNDDLASAEPRVFVYQVQNGKANDVAAILKDIFLGQARSASSTPAGAKKPAQRAPANPFETQTNQKEPEKKPLPQRAPGVEAGKGGVAVVDEDTRIFADEITNTIIVLATPEDYKIIEKTIGEIDVVPRQVLIEVLAAEIILSDDLKFGFEWFLETKFKAGTTDLIGIPAFKSEGLIGSEPSSIPSDVFSFAMLDTSGVVRAFLQTIASDNKAKILASPHIVVSDNKEASINVGQDVPTVTSSTNVTGTTDIQNTIQYRQVGVNLTVNPQINEGGLVSLDISTEVSSLSNEVAQGVDSPIFNSQKASSHVVVQNGQTVVMGGMMREDRDSQRSGIPLLMDIPYLGNLFSSYRDSSRRVELVILITPRVIKNQEDAKRIREQFSKSMDLKMVADIPVAQGNAAESEHGPFKEESQGDPSP